jgi:hypothetical protein
MPRAKVRRKYRTLDQVPQERFDRQFLPMSRHFVGYAGKAALIDLAFVLLALLEYAVAPTFTLWFRVVTLVRTLVLMVRLAAAMCCAAPVDVVAMYGTKEVWKYPRFMRNVPVVGFWYVLGLFEFYLLRIPALLLDLLSPLWGQPPKALLLWLPIDALFLVAWKITVNFLYVRGVRNNVFNSLLRR